MSVIRRSVEVATTPATVWAVLDDPHRHHELDGSGTLRPDVDGPSSLSLSATFSTAMHQYRVSYRSSCTITAYEPERLIEWSLATRHRWRWELEDLGGGRTRLTETWDATAAPLRLVFRLGGVQARNARGIEATLQGLADRYGS